MGQAVRRWIRGNTNIALLTGLACLLAVLAVLGARAARNAFFETYETRLYNAHSANAIDSLVDLVEDFDRYQIEFLPLMPPGMVLNQPQGLRMYLENLLPRERLTSADIETWEGVNVYPVAVREDPLTRERVVLSRTGTELLRLSAPPDYDADLRVLRLYPDADPVERDASRIAFSYRLISEPALRAYCLLKAAEKDEADALAADSLDDDTGFMMLMGGGGITNVVITGLTLTTNETVLDIAWPDGFTNRLDVYFSTDLVQGDWRLISEPLETIGGASLAWTNTGSVVQNEKTGFFIVGNHDLDSDGDGYSDVFERLVLKTDPHDADSHGVELSGTVLYFGQESGPVHVRAVTDAASWAKTWQTVLPGPGGYTNLVGNRRDLWLKAFMDLDGDGEWSVWEPWGLHSVSAVHPTQDVSGLNIVIRNQPSVWGQVDYAGSATGNVHVIAVSEHGWDTAYSAFIPWLQSYDVDMNPIYASFPMDYAIVGLPPGNYYIRAFIDENYDGQYTHLEAGGQYALDPIAVNSRVTGVDFEIGLDTDEDGIPDWWEMEHFGGATAAAAGADTDGDGLSNLQEYLYGTDPHNWDTDGDGLSDYDEIYVYGTDPINPDTDGDGLPDGWEVQYGLDPQDATGDNGADGDPDGDGFTNLQEFQMGGDPANPAINATQLIYRLMHSRGDSSLRVDVEDSYNCGGTNPNRQEVEDVFSVGPLMHCGYLLSLTVEGRVEDQDSGYDKVSVRSYVSTNLQSEVPFFEGHNNGNGCAMVEEQTTTNVWFWSNGSVRLRYDTVDGLYHTDAYAEITAAAFVDLLKVDTVEASCPKADNSPQIFEGHRTDFGNPCAATSPGQALIIFYDAVLDANFQVKDFDVTLKANVLPTSVTSDQLGESWAKVEGPTSGSLNRTDTFEVKYQNPKIGGLYKFEFDLGLSGCTKSGANVDLPLAGADMTTWLDTETKAVGTWASTHRTATETANYSAIPGVTMYRVYQTWCSISGSYFDYVFDPVDAQQHAPCRRFQPAIGPNGQYGYVTVNGVVVHGSKINNMMWALFGRYWGWSETSLRLGAHLNQLGRNLRLDGATSQSAIGFGNDIHANPSANITTILTPANLRTLQDPNALIEEKLWPSPDAADTGNSTFTRPTLPTTP